MAQYDVYPNPSASSRNQIPYVVDMQSNLLSDLTTRQVVPLALRVSDAPAAPRRLSPQFTIEGHRVSLLPHLAAPLNARLLRQPLASLAGHAGELRDALDAVVSGV